MKKRKDNRRIRQPKSSTSSFPIDLTSEILLRLPGKSIVRFRCVSKLWSSITTDPYFINSFENRSRRPPPNLLVYFRKNEELFVSSIPQNSNKSSFSSFQPIDRYQMEFKGAHSIFSPTESVHGLICFQESENPVVWNPSKRQFLTLPKLIKSWRDLTVFLGYDPVERKHKVVCIPFNRYSDVCRVLTLGSSSAQESWRTVKINHKHRSYLHTSGRCINGVIYYVAYCYHTHAWVVMSFDVRSEKFDMIELPTDIRRVILITYEGKLASVDRNNGRRLWILEDAGKHKWSSQDFLLPFGHYDARLRIFWSLKGFTHAGEFVFAPSVFSNSSYVLFWDPVRNSFRRFHFEELVDDKSWLNNGIQYHLHVFPNHIENQIS